MKNLFKIFLIVFLFLGVYNVAYAVGCSGTGACYWVGGTGNTSDTAHWATSSGGATTGGAPTSADSCIFDTLSNATSYTVTHDSALSCLDFTVGAPLTGNVTRAGTGTLNTAGSYTGYSGQVITHSGTVTFSATATGKTVTSAGTAFASAVVFSGAGGEWTLQDAFSNGSSNLNTTGGTFITGGYSVTTNNWTYSGASTRVLTLTTSTITVGNNVNAASSGITLNAGTSNIIMTGNAPTFTGAGLSYATTTFTGTPDNSGPTIAEGNTFVNLRRTNTGGYTNLLLGGDQTVTGTCTFTGNNANSKRIFILSTTMATTRTLTCANVSMTNVDFQDITGAGAGTWTGTSIGDAGGNSGITFTTATTRYWDGDTGAWNSTTEWSTSSGGGTGASVPLPQDDVVFDSNSFSAGSQVVTIGTTGFRLGKNINWTGVTNTPTMTFGHTSKIYGSLTLVAGMIVNDTSSVTFQGRGAYGITSAGQTMTPSIVIDAPTGTYTLQDAFLSSSTFNLTRGGYDVNDFDHTSTTFALSNSNTRSLSLGTGTITLTGTGTVWNAANVTGLTFDAETSTIKITDASSTDKTFGGGGLTYWNIWWTGVGTGDFRITGSNTYNDFKVDTPPQEILVTAGTNQTVTTFTVTGTSGNLMTIGSITASGHTWTKAGGGTICVDYGSISRSTGSPGTTWYASNSTDGGNNSGWTFGACPSAGGAVQVDSGVIFFE